jgi:S1-C subfamily serine protease
MCPSPGLSRVAALTLLMVSACTAPGREVPYASARTLPTIEGRVATNLDLLASGRTLVDEYVTQLPEPRRKQIAAVIARGKQASVRIVARYGFSSSGASYTENSGSGVLVAGSDGSAVVLTAGHTFADTSADLRVSVFSLAGREIAATMVDIEHEKRDFAVMRCEPFSASDVVLAGMAAPRPGELVVALGYPDQCGVDRAGRVVRGESYTNDLLEPLALVLEVASTEPLLLLPVAGALPLGGFSGGGLFDLDGSVVGVLTGSEWEPNKDAMVVRVFGCSTAAMRSVP